MARISLTATRRYSKLIGTLNKFGFTINEIYHFSNHRTPLNRYSARAKVFQGSQDFCSLFSEMIDVLSKNKVSASEILMLKELCTFNLSTMQVIYHIKKNQSTVEKPKEPALFNPIVRINITVLNSYQS